MTAAVRHYWRAASFIPPLAWAGSLVPAPTAHALALLAAVVIAAAVWGLVLLPCLVLVGKFGPRTLRELCPRWDDGWLPALQFTREQRATWRHAHPGKARSIPARLHRMVLGADRYRCINCGFQGARAKRNTGLQADHVFPFAHGGLTSPWNLVTLCARCNKTKSDYWPWPSGHPSYHAWDGFDNIAAAASILGRERARRWWPARVLLLAWAA
jgi:hypothetical protein